MESLKQQNLFYRTRYATQNTYWCSRLSNPRILWYTEVKDRKAGLRDLQVTEDKIYVLDSDQTLHIFEKEV